MKKKQSVATWRKVMYGAGEISNTLIFTVVPLFLMFYLTDVLGVPAAIAGVVSFAGNIWDAITDPYAGYVSDKCKSRMGRRRPFFLYFAIPMALAFGLMFSVPTGLDMGWKIALVTVAYMALLVLSTFFIVPYLTYGMEIDTSYDGRTSVSAWRMLFSIAFGLVGATIPSMIWTAAPVASEGFKTMAWILAIPIAITPFLAFFSGKEPKVEEVKQEKRSGFFKDLRSAVKNADFSKGLIIYVLSWVGIGVLQLLLIYYVKYVLEMYDQYAIIAGVVFGVAILCLPLWVWLSSKFDKRKAFIWGAGLFCVSLAVLLLPASFVRSIIWIIVPLLGVGMSALHVMPSAIVPEAIELAGAKDKSAGNGSYYGIMTFLTKVGNAAFNAIIMGLLGVSGYISTQEEVFVEQPAAAILAIKLLIVLLPVAVFATAMVVCGKFRVGRAEHERYLEAEQQPQP